MEVELFGGKDELAVIKNVGDWGLSEKTDEAVLVSQLPNWAAVI